MASVTFDGVTKRFGSVTAVEAFDLTVTDGEFMVLLGPSGCGKSTLLRMVAGLEEISGGGLSIGDDVVNDVAPARRDVSMVFQSYALYPHMTVTKNIESPLVSKPSRIDSSGDGTDEVRKLTKIERQERIDEAARMLGLGPLLERKPAELSGGQRQRVALARAAVSRPAVFLMDEPLSNLDAKLRSQTRAELVELHDRLGTTVIYVTHDQVEAMTMATRIAIMCDGRLQQVGTPREVYERPANVFVAHFVGTPPMNTAPVEVRDGHASLGRSQVKVDAPDGPAVLGVRPEHLAVDAEGPIEATVRHVEWLGHEALVTCDLEGGDGATVDGGEPLRTIGAEAEAAAADGAEQMAATSADRWIVRINAATDPVPDVGRALRLRPTGGNVHCFDRDTEDRLDAS